MLESDPVKIRANWRIEETQRQKELKDPCLPYPQLWLNFPCPNASSKLVCPTEAKLASHFFPPQKSLLFPLQLSLPFNCPSTCISQRSSYASQLKYTDIWETNLSSAWPHLLVSLHLDPSCWLLWTFFSFAISSRSGRDFHKELDDTFV